MLNFSWSNPHKSRYKFPQVVFTSVSASNKTPTTGIFGNKLSVCIWCPTSTPRLEIWAIPPSQTQLQLFPRKIFIMHIRLIHAQQSHGFERLIYVS